LPVPFPLFSPRGRGNLSTEIIFLNWLITP
jgi:hypothetical protein